MHAVLAFFIAFICFLINRSIKTRCCQNTQHKSWFVFGRGISALQRFTVRLLDGVNKGKG